jgi:5'-deoxynucleotidase
VNPERAAALALFHDATEVLPGDLPTPIKYFNPDIRAAYQAIEGVASGKLLDMIPAELRRDYRALFFETA